MLRFCSRLAVISIRSLYDSVKEQAVQRLRLLIKVSTIDRLLSKRPWLPVATKATRPRQPGAYYFAETPF